MVRVAVWQSSVFAQAPGPMEHGCDQWHTIGRTDCASGPHHCAEGGVWVPHSCDFWLSSEIRFAERFLITRKIYPRAAFMGQEAPNPVTPKLSQSSKAHPWSSSRQEGSRPLVDTKHTAPALAKRRKGVSVWKEGWFSPCGQKQQFKLQHLL